MTVHGNLNLAHVLVSGNGDVVPVAVIEDARNDCGVAIPAEEAGGGDEEVSALPCVCEVQVIRELLASDAGMAIPLMTRSPVRALSP